MKSLGARVSLLDRQLFDRVAGTESELLDQVLPRLTVAADRGKLWLGVTGVLVLTGRRDARRAAIRGLVSLGLASAGTNLLAKGAVGRRRPVAGRVPPRRVRGRTPVTTSFPSGHSASAAAFATGAALEMPALALPLGALAVAVAASRVVTGAHYPSDVAAGSALGLGAALLTLRAWSR